MSVAKNLMEIREQDIRSHYEPAYPVARGFRASSADRNGPCGGKPGGGDAVARRDCRQRRAFRSTTPGLATRRQRSGKEGIDP